MKLSKTILPLLLSSALWIPAANAAGTTAETAQPQSNQQQPAANPSAEQPANAQPANAQPAQPADNQATGAASAQPNDTSATANASVDTSGWTGKTVMGSDGKKLGSVSAAAGDKVTVGTKFGDIELASNLVADDGSGNLTASTTSMKDAQAMAKSQKGDMKGAQVASKRRFAKKEPKAKVQPASMKSGEETTPSTETAPAGEAPATAPADQVNPTPPANTPQKDQTTNPSQPPK